ncbi:MAG: hypothetical protein WAM39_18950 [Bryobacteraceae bacterium]
MFAGLFAGYKFALRAPDGHRDALSVISHALARMLLPDYAIPPYDRFMRNELKTAVLLGVFASVCLSAEGTASNACTPPPGFVDSPHPTVAPTGELVSHTEQVVIDRPFRMISREDDGKNDRQRNNIPNIRPSGSLPGVKGIYLLTSGEWGAPGSRRIVCLTDGSTTHEEVLEHESLPNFSRFRYIVWNYTTPRARPVEYEYGVGEFRIVPIDGARTRVKWTYSFKLKDNVFPGNLGAWGNGCFASGFLTVTTPE